MQSLYRAASNRDILPYEMDEPIRVIIVDDEVFPRRTLLKHVPWQKLHISVREASDGEEAFALVQALPPDILITDIRMPRMDGVALAQKVRAAFPAIKIVFLSAYADAEYLKSAISLQATSFLEKPIDIAAITKLLGVLAEQIAKERLHFLSQKDTLALNLAFGSSYGQSSFVHALFPLFHGAFYAALLLRGSAWNSDLGAAILARISLATLSSIKDDQGIIHIACDTKGALLRLEAELPGYATFVTGTLYFALGAAVTSIEELSQSYRNAQEKMDRAYLAGYTALCRVALRPDTDCLSSLSGDFGAALSAGEYDKAATALQGYCEAVRLYCSVQDAKARVALCLKEIEDRIEEKQKHLAIKELSNMQSLYQCPHIDVAQELLLWRLSKLAEIDEQLAQGQDNFDRIEQYLCEHYDLPLFSLTRLCTDLGLSSSYVCRLYKEKSTMTIHAAIENMRMEKAKQLLRQSYAKLDEIAPLCGYSDPKYFAKVFKKYTGIGPLYYRKRAP